MDDNPYQPVPASPRPPRTRVQPIIIVALALCVFAAFLAGYWFGHAHGFWDAERLQIGDEASGLAPGEPL